MRTASACRVCPIKRLPLFRGLGPEKWERFSRLKNANNFQRGNIIFYQGNRPLGLHFICEGRVKLVKQDASGRAQIVRVVEAPDLLGERAFFAGKPYACTWEVLGDAHICFLEARHFWELFGTEPHALRLLLSKFAEELGRAHESLHCMTVCTVKQRVARHLLSLSAEAPGAGRRRGFTLADSRMDLAGFLGTTPEAISRTLGEFSSAGWIEIAGRRVGILEEGVLRGAACPHLPASDPSGAPGHS